MPQNQISNIANRISHIDPPRPGFKQTKIGWLPVEWEVVRSNFAINFLGGNAYNSRDAVDNGIRWLKIANVGVQRVKWETESFLPVKFKEDVKYRLKAGDCVMALTRPILNDKLKIAILNEQDSPALLNQRVAKLSNKKNSCLKFIYFAVQSPKYVYTMETIMAGTDPPNIGFNELKSIPIPLPPLPEQTAIANCLSTWDRAITTTRHLLDQLKTRKKGLMQQLLTGEVRLPGFEGEWEEVRAGSLFASISDKKHNGEFEVLSATQERGVIPRSEVGIDIKYEKSSLSSYKKVTEGDFVISLRSFQGGIEYSSYTGLVSPAYTVLRGTEKTVSTYFTEYFKTQTFINRLNSIIYGIRDGKQISYKEFSSLKISLPSNSEQEAIGRVIESVQAEIALYEAKLSTLETQKRGLMQQLLTGRKRLVAGDRTLEGPADASRSSALKN